MRQPRIEWDILILLLCMFGFSLAIIWSVNPTYFTSQLAFFLTGIIIFFIFRAIRADIYQKVGILFYAISVILLIITLLSPDVRGSSRWIFFGDYRIQPSEIIKPFLIVSYASFLVNKKSGVLNSFAIFLLLLIPLILIFLQPDLGSAIIYFAFSFAMIFANGLPLSAIAVSVVFGLIGSPFIWHILKDYQRQRILNFLSPNSDPQGAGYNAIQAMIAVGSGKLFGQGLGRGSQSHLRFLPENHTDFVFASLVEEFGFLGSTLVLVFYSYLFYRLLRLMIQTQDRFTYLVIVGVFMQIFTQFFVNIAMNIGLIPITGVTLPLISAGGSSIIATLISLGIVFSLSKNKKHTPLVIG
ncbi:rod shape-determining protein RodA [Candidatus Gottesmanbacteria bacterium]|nr:rod shape-determining protein RodA [Candidatus Gottesmanbacteria bacterium]